MMSYVPTAIHQDAADRVELTTGFEQQKAVTTTRNTASRRKLRILVLCLLALPTVSFQPQPPTKIHQYRTHHAGTPQYTSSLQSTSSKSPTEKAPFDCLKDAMERMHILQLDPNSNSMLLKKQSIRVGPSSIPGAGKGVFATKNIKAGTVVGFFPVHGIGLELSDTNALATATEEDQSYFDSQNEVNSIEEEDTEVGTQEHYYLHYLIGSRPLCGYQAKEQGGTLFVDVNPTRAVQDAWISHYINDGAIVGANSEEGLLEYYRKSKARKNCVTIPFGPSPILATVTNSKVKKGDELFTTYGGSYWLDSMLKIAAEGNDEVEEEPAEITEAVLLQAKETAKDLFDAMNQAKVTHASLQTELEQLFSKVAV